MDSALRAAQAAHVRIDAVDPMGLSLGRHTPSNAPPEMVVRPGPGQNAVFALLDDPYTARRNALRALAEATGGRAIVDNNTAHAEVTAVVVDGAAYYLLGVARPPGTPGSFHRFQVRINRPGVAVSTRDGYYDPPEELVSRTRLLEDATAGPLEAVGFPLRLTTATFATTSEGLISFVLAAESSPASSTSADEGATEILASLFELETARLRGQRHLRVSLSESSRPGAVEVLSTLNAPPGRYALRVGAARGDRVASVFAVVDVPDFSQPLALSTLVLRVAPEPLTDRDVTGLLPPVRFTTRRLFRRSEEVGAFVRIYRQDDSREPVTVDARVLDAAGGALASDRATFTAVAGSAAFVDYEVTLPLGSLTRGAYLLAIDVRLGERAESRHLRFEVE